MRVYFLSIFLLLYSISIQSQPKEGYKYIEKYEYNNLARLTKVINPQGGIISYVYNQEGKIIEKSVQADSVMYQ